MGVYPGIDSLRENSDSCKKKAGKITTVAFSMGE